jgi:hypothetical protein
MVLQIGLQPVLGAFGCVLGGQATKSTVLVRPKDFFVLILSWEARFSWTIGTFVGLHQSWVILAVFWVARPQNLLSV